MLTLRYNEPVFILMLRGRVGCLRQWHDKADACLHSKSVPSEIYEKNVALGQVLLPVPHFLLSVSFHQCSTLIHIVVFIVLRIASVVKYGAIKSFGFLCTI